MSAKRELQKKMFRYLKSNLDPNIIRSVRQLDVVEIVAVLSDWVYDERNSFLIEVTNKIANKKPERKNITESDFIKELKKL